MSKPFVWSINELKESSLCLCLLITPSIILRATFIDWWHLVISKSGLVMYIETHKNTLEFAQVTIDLVCTKPPYTDKLMCCVLWGGRGELEKVMMGGGRAWIFPGLVFPVWEERERKERRGESEEDYHRLLPRFCLFCFCGELTNLFSMNWISRRPQIENKKAGRERIKGNIKTGLIRERG